VELNNTIVSCFRCVDQNIQLFLKKYSFVQIIITSTLVFVSVYNQPSFQLDLVLRTRTFRIIGAGFYVLDVRPLAPTVHGIEGKIVNIH